jgi:hypothetical protein
VSVFELDISWAETARERRSLQWALVACNQVRGVFVTTRNDVLAVLFDGDRWTFDSFIQTLQPDLNTYRKGALQ